MTRAPSAAELAATQAFPPMGQLVDIDGTSFHFVTRGAGPDLILIHGAGGNTRDWTFSMMDKLSDRFRVTAIDRPGLGHTTRLPQSVSNGESLSEQSDLLARAMEHIGIKRAVIAGQSYGGAVTLNFALRHPEMASALVTISGVSHPWDGKLDLWYRINSTRFGQSVVIPIVSKIVTRRLAERTVSEIFEPDHVPEGYLDHLGVSLALRKSQLRANAQQVNRLHGDISAQYQNYDQIEVPLEIIHGTADTIVPFDLHAARLVQDVSTARLTRLDGTGHMPHHAEEAAVIAAIDRAAKRAGLR